MVIDMIYSGPFINDVCTRGEGRGQTYLLKFIKEQRGKGVKKRFIRANVIHEWSLSQWAMLDGFYFIVYLQLKNEKDKKNTLKSYPTRGQR